MNCSKCKKYSGNSTGYLEINIHLCDKCNAAWVKYSDAILIKGMKDFISFRRSTYKKFLRAIKSWVNQPDDEPDYP